MTNSAPSQIVSLRENDVYAELVSAKGTSFAQQIGGLSALVFGFNTEQAGLTVSLSDLRLVGATSLSLPASLTFTGTGSSDYVIGNYLFPATGLADGFDLYGTFSSLGNPTGINGIGFQVYAVVPEPATVAFGLAMVGGLGLLEIRRRKIS